MPYPSARRHGVVLVAALVLSLALPLSAARPAPVAAQAPGLRLTVEQPAAGSDARETIVIGGWAVDTTSTSGTGVGAEGVEVWLGPAGSGQFLGTAGYGDPRPEVAAQFGNDRYLPSGFRYFWSSATIATYRPASAISGIAVTPRPGRTR